MQLNEQQKKSYNTYRAEGMSPEKALTLATKNTDNQYNPALEAGVDNILFGKKSLTSAVGRGLKEAAFSGFETVYKDTQKYGAGFALAKSPLSLAAGLGRGVGEVAGGILETADDLTGEVVSGALQPVVEDAVNSDIGQDILASLNELDEKGRGIPGDIFDSLDLLGVTALAKSGAANSIKSSIKSSIRSNVDNLAKTSIRSTARNATSKLSDFLPKANTLQELGDSAVETGLKGINKFREIPAKLSESAKRSIDRRIVRTSTANPELAKKSIVDLYKKGIVPGVKKKNKTIKNIDKIDEAIKRTVPALAKKYDDALSTTDDHIRTFAEIIDTEKKDVFSKLQEGLEQAGKDQKVIDTQPILDELDILLDTERANFSPELRQAIQKARNNLADELPDGTFKSKTISPSGAQDLIADLNAELQAFYRGSTSGTNGDVVIRNLIANNLRKMTDDVFEDIGEGSFKDLKGRYADLKKLEDDVVHRAVFEAQKGGGLADLTDILSAGDIVSGAISPVFLAKGTAQFFTKEIIKSLSDKSELIRQMFLYGKNLPEEAAEAAVKATPAATVTPNTN